MTVLFGGTVGLFLVFATYATIGSVILDERLRAYLYLVAILVFLHPFVYLVRTTLVGFDLERYSEPLVVLEKVFLALVGLTLAGITDSSLPLRAHLRFPDVQI